MGVHQAQRGVELKEGQQEDRGRGHAVGQEPEEHMLVAHKAVAREGISCRQRHGDRDHRVDTDVDQAVDIARIPRWVGEDRPVVGPGEVLRPDGEVRQDFLVRLEAHVDHPVNGQQGKDDVDGQKNRPLVKTLVMHVRAPCGRCPGFASSCRGQSTTAK